MTPEAQRLAIAVAVGLISRAAVEEYEKHKPHKMPVFQYYDIPDYLNDLNAIRHAISTSSFGINRCERFGEELQIIIKRDLQAGRNMLLADMFPWHASATQMSEAFLKTLNLWTE